MLPRLILLILTVIFFSGYAFSSPGVLKSVKFTVQSEKISSYGEAFLLASKTLRRYMDTITDKDISDSAFSAWIDSLPLFSVKETLKLSKNPRVIIACARKLAILNPSEAMLIIRRIANYYKNSPLENDLMAILLLIDAPLVKSQVGTMMKSGLKDRLFKAAYLLLAAKNQAGFKLVRQYLENEDFSDEIIWLLGKFGKDEDIKILTSSIGKFPGILSLKAARGRIKLRERFPEQYNILLRFDPEPALRNSKTDFTMHESWFMAFDTVIENSNKWSSICKKLSRLKANPPDKANSELWHRQIQSLEKISLNILHLIDNLSKWPRWPQNFKQAVKFISQNSKHSLKGINYKAQKISAAIYVLKALGDLLEYEDLAQIKSTVTSLTPGGNRALDENSMTSWQGKKGDSLILKFTVPASIERIYLMNYCPIGGNRISKINVTLKSGDKKYQASYDVDTSRTYYQKIKVNKQAESVEKITVKILKTTGKTKKIPACISEIRFR